MTSTFHSTKTRLSPSQFTLSSVPPLPTKHWSQTCHETILFSNDCQYSFPLLLEGGAENGQFVYLKESVSLLKNKSSMKIIKGGKIDAEEILLTIDRHQIAGYTLFDVQQLIETLSTNGKQIKLKTVKSGLTKDLRQFLDGRFEKDSIDNDLQQTIRDNLYMRTVPCTTRPPRPGEINGQDYTFLSVKDFRTLEKSGKLLESGMYKGHYYGTPRPPRGVFITNNSLTRRSNSANEMFQQFPSEIINKKLPPQLSGELISCSLRKSQHGFGFTIIRAVEKNQHFLQVKDILPDGPAAKDGKLQRGDILVYINDTNVLGYSHTDVVKIFQSLAIGDMIHITICRGYPLAVNFDDPQIDIVSLNGVHQLPNGGYKEYQPENHSRTHVIKIRKGEHGFGFTVADSSSGQRVKSIVDRQRCQNLCENDLLLSINGYDLFGKQHTDIVDILMKCPMDTETTFVIQRGDSDVNNNPFIINGNGHGDKTIQENNEIEAEYLSPRVTERPRSKTPTSYTPIPMFDTQSFRTRTPIAVNNTATFSTSNGIQTSAPLVKTDFSPDSIYTFDRQTPMTRSARDIRPVDAPLIRSKTPGPEFGTTLSSSYRANAVKPRSKTPTAYEMSSNTMQNSRSLQSIHPQYIEQVVNLTLLRSSDGFGLRILGGEEEKSQVSIGHIVPNSPADIDGRLHINDEIIKIDGHSTIRASHEKVVQLMQRAKERQHVCIIVRRYLHSETNSYYQTNRDSHPIYRHDPYLKSTGTNEMRHVVLQKTDDYQSFGFVIISSQNKAGAIVGKIIPNSPADQCGQLHLNDRILAVNGIDLSHMVHTDVVNLIKESGRMITLTIAPPLPYDDRSLDIQNGIRPSSSSPMNIADDNNHTLRNAFSHNPLNSLEKNSIRSSSRTNGILKSYSVSDDYYVVDLQRPYINSSFGFSIRGGREFSVPLFILKLAENGPAACDGQMKAGDQIIEINGRSTYGMTHSDAITLIRDGGLYVRLLLRKTNAPPPSLDEVKSAMGNGFESPNVYWKASPYT
ncbi:hypothetical protein I4U23_026488 [Adineta vaga]|nr:hypothetical protein I4U23_026488 [Adineta vaga]